MKVMISGGKGNLAQNIIEQSSGHGIVAPSRQEMNVSNLWEIEDEIKHHNPDVFIHAAAYTRPMHKHQDNPDKSIEANIIGTSNVVLACMKYNVKLVYISTDYVYPGISGDYNEDDALSPFAGKSDGVNKYGWSKLGGECAVRMYDNSLILRTCICDHPFPHGRALTDVKKSLMYNFEAARIILKLLNEKGVINLGGDSQSVYDFASKKNPRIKKITRQDVKDVCIAPDTSMNTSKLKEILND